MRELKKVCKTDEETPTEVTKESCGTMYSLNNEFILVLFLF